MSLPPTSRSLPMALHRARETVMAPIRKMLTRSGITEQQWRILRVLSEHGPQDQVTLADRASLLAPSVTRIVASMKERGLVMQTPHPTDRRKHLLKITLEGTEIINENLTEAMQIAEQFRRKIGSENYEQLLDLLEELARN